MFCPNQSVASDVSIPPPPFSAEMEAMLAVMWSKEKFFTTIKLILAIKSLRVGEVDLQEPVPLSQAADLNKHLKHEI